MGYRNIETLLPEEWSIREILSFGFGGCLRGFEDTAEVTIDELSTGRFRPTLRASIDFGFDGVGNAQEWIRRVAYTGNGCGYLIKSGGIEVPAHVFDPADVTRYVAIRDDGCDA